MSRRAAKQQEVRKTAAVSHEPAVKKVKLTESKELELLIPREYCDLAEAFSEKELYVLAPH